MRKMDRIIGFIVMGKQQWGNYCCLGSLSHMEEDYPSRHQRDSKVFIRVKDFQPEQLGGGLPAGKPKGD